MFYFHILIFTLFQIFEKEYEKYCILYRIVVIVLEDFLRFRKFYLFVFIYIFQSTVFVKLTIQ